MSIFASMGAGAKNEFLEGYGDIVVKLTKASKNVGKGKNQGKTYYVLNFRVEAASPDTEGPVVGREYAFMHIDPPNYPDSDIPRYYSALAAFKGVLIDPNSAEATAEALGVDLKDIDVKTKKGMALAAIEIDAAIEAMPAECFAGEGAAWKGRTASITLRRGSKPSEKTGKFPTFLTFTATPEGFVVDGELTDDAKNYLKSEKWTFEGSEEWEVPTE